ncbi:hypothetical protein ACFE04_004501 [Oxalis oulophora]
MVDDKALFTVGKYDIYNQGANSFQACYNRSPEDGNGSSENPWLHQPMSIYFPYFILQLSLIIFITRLLIILIKPLKTPHLVSHIIGGILLSPGVFLIFDIPEWSTYVFPYEGLQVLETAANLAIMYYMFLVGLEMDLRPIRHVETKQFCISIAGILPPLAAGVYSFFYQSDIHGTKAFTHMFKTIDGVTGSVFWGITLTVTSFPDVARLLSDLKLMQTYIGKTALISALLNDIVSWFLHVIALTSLKASVNMENDKWSVILKLLPTILFILFSWLVLRPIVIQLINYGQEDTNKSSRPKYTNFHVYTVITTVAVFGLITDVLGSNSIVGAFMFGLIIPSGELGTLVMEKLEDFVTGILLPSFFLTSGLRFNIKLLLDWIKHGKGKWINFLAAIALSSSIKIISTCLVSLFFGFQLFEGFCLGVISNTKGVMALIVVNSGRNLMGFNQVEFTIIITACLFMTISVGPLITFIYKPAKRLKLHKKTILQKRHPDSELGVITCVHSPRNVTTMINFIQTLNASTRSPLSVFALRLVELTGRTTAMLIIHDSLKGGENSPEENDEIISPFLHMDRGGLTVQPLTVVSPYPTMHEDIINIAHDKCVNLIVIPFHKQAMADGELDEGNPSAREVNLHLLENSPCSIGLLVDRRLSSVTRTSSVRGMQVLCVVMIFIGGPDDREALACAWRMARTPGVSLTVMRYLSNPRNQQVTHVDGDSEREKQIDSAYVNEFRFKTMSDESITYLEKQISSVEETVQAVKENSDDIHLYVVGRGGSSPLTLGLADWSESPELGAIGDILVQCKVSSSVLVLQQYANAASGSDPAAQAFVNHRKKDDDYY